MYKAEDYPSAKLFTNSHPIRGGFIYVSSDVMGVPEKILISYPIT